jgi:hypothetical protein
MIENELFATLDDLVATTTKLLHDEIERNKLDQANRNKPNPEYLRVMGLVL